MRYGDNIEIKSIVKSGYDYTLQVWVDNYIIESCGHKSKCSCNGKRLKGQDIRGLLVKQ